MTRNRNDNARQSTVVDPVFVSQQFFDPRDVVQVKYEMVRGVRVDGQSVTQAAASFGFSRQAFYAAQSALARGGLRALMPRRPGPRRRHKVRAEILAFLQKARTDEPRIRTQQLAERAEALFGVRLHPRTIERVLGPRTKPRLAARD
jgi:transposase